MRQRWRWQLSVGAAAVVCASLLAQGGVAAAGTAAVAAPGGAQVAVTRQARGGAQVAVARQARGGAQVAVTRQARAVTASPAVVAVPAWHRVKKTLRPGMTGADVKKVQKRLRTLKYYPGSVDGRFGADTLEAVWAFKEVQGLRTRKNPDDIGAAMERRLANPKAPRPVSVHHQNNRIDISLRHEFLVLYRHGKVRLISHVSTGGGYSFCEPGGGCGHIAITPTGNFTTLSFLPGWVQVPLGEMFNPVFFIGTAYAIHGDTDVPRQPASHGCVRVPMDIAGFFHELVKIHGTRVYIRHR
jgi:L,D-transpeptidase catalytic domain/Putative peptidoglycan binding domain